MDKKGAGLGSMYPAVLTIIIVGIILGIGIYALNQVAIGTASETITVTNETMTLVTGTGDSTATASDCQARLFNATAPTVLNGSGGEGINAANYTFTSAGLLTAKATIADVGYNNSLVNVSYSYTGTLRTGTTDACTTLATSGTGVGGFANWIAVIVVVLAAAIVLGIVISSFGKGTAA